VMHHISLASHEHAAAPNMPSEKVYRERGRERGEGGDKKAGKTVTQEDTGV
jgi:hypothetical protein